MAAGNTQDGRQRAHCARVLSLIAGLDGELEHLDLDTIDGEFYWRCGRIDLLDRIHELYATRPPRPFGEPGDAPGDIFRFFRHGMRCAQDFIHLQMEVAELFPDRVWRRLEHGKRVPMRPPQVFNMHSQQKSGEFDHSLHVRVFSAVWTGDDVERQIDAWLAERVEGSARADESASRVSFNVDFSFVEESQQAQLLWDFEFDRRGGVPYVEITTPFPLPPAGVVGREYEGVVRGLKRWHLRLPGASANRQDKEVAVRTWGVGLLVVAGIRFGEAMRLVCEAGQLTEVSQTRFGADRQRLLERVPEARAVLMQRRRTS